MTRAYPQVWTVTKLYAAVKDLPEVRVGQGAGQGVGVFLCDDFVAWGVLHAPVSVIR